MIEIGIGIGIVFMAVSLITTGVGLTVWLIREAISARRSSSKEQ